MNHSHFVDIFNSELENEHDYKYFPDCFLDGSIQRNVPSIHLNLTKDPPLYLGITTSKSGRSFINASILKVKTTIKSPSSKKQPSRNSHRSPARSIVVHVRLHVGN